MEERKEDKRKGHGEEAPACAGEGMGDVVALLGDSCWVWHWYWGMLGFRHCAFARRMLDWWIEETMSEWRRNSL